MAGSTGTWLGLDLEARPPHRLRMRRFFSCLCSLALAATGTAAYAQEAMVDNVTFEASGHPGWKIEVGDDIGLRLGSEFYGGGHGGDIAFTEQRFPQSNVRVHEGVRRWRSTSGTGTIVIIATPGACSDSGGTLYTHHVRLIRNWGEPRFRNLSGCGGRFISRPDSQ